MMENAVTTDNIYCLLCGIKIIFIMFKDINLQQPSQIVRLEGTIKGYTKLMDKVYYKEVYFDLLYPIWFKKFILHIVGLVVTWV